MAKKTETTSSNTVTLTFKKETKGTIVYHNETEGVAISQVYVRKDCPAIALRPQSITLTIAAL